MLSERANLDGRIENRRKLIESLGREASYGSTRLFASEPDIVISSDQGVVVAEVKPGTGAASRRVLEEAGRPVTTAEVIDELERRGWLPEAKDPRAAVGAALWYLANRDSIVKVGDDQNRRWASKNLSLNGDKEPD